MHFIAFYFLSNRTQITRLRAETPQRRAGTDYGILANRINLSTADFN
jgi:hypothetical protein